MTAPYWVILFLTKSAYRILLSVPIVGRLMSSLVCLVRCAVPTDSPCLSLNETIFEVISLRIMAIARLLPNLATSCLPASVSNIFMVVSPA